METLTQRQSEILEMIRTTIADTGMPPTRVEIAESFGFNSPNAAEGHLRALARKGAIELLPGSSRGIQVVADEFYESGLPVVGSVAAGSPILAQEYIEEYYDLDPALFSPAADYLLKVRGLSMKDAGILDGDLLAVSSSSTARTGQIVVARINNEVTVKRLKRTRKREIYLLPENDDFKPIMVKPGDDFQIEGLGVGIIRNNKTL